MCIQFTALGQARRTPLELLEVRGGGKVPDTPSPPTKSFPTKSPRVELSGRLPIELYGHENSHP